jgi:hypothetical protein
MKEGTMKEASGFVVVRTKQGWRSAPHRSILDINVDSEYDTFIRLTTGHIFQFRYGRLNGHHIRNYGLDRAILGTTRMGTRTGIFYA